FFLFLTVLSPRLGAQEERRDPFKADYQDQVIRVKQGESFSFDVRFQIPPNHWLYDDKTSVFFVKTAELFILKPDRPSPQATQDPFLKKTTKVYFHDFEQKVNFLVPKDASVGRHTLEATLRYQGCSEDFCYRPMHRTILLPVEVTSPGEAWLPANPPAAPPNLEARQAEEVQPTLWPPLQRAKPEGPLGTGPI